MRHARGKLVLEVPDKKGVTHTPHTWNSKGGRNLNQMAGAKYAVEVKPDENMMPIVRETAKTTTTFFFARAAETPSDDKAAVFKDLDGFCAIVPWETWSTQLRMGGWQAPTAKWLACIAREVSGEVTSVTGEMMCAAT